MIAFGTARPARSRSILGPRPARPALLGAACAIACACVLSFAQDASAQRVYVYGPPPPPPPRVYVYAPPPRYAYEEVDPSSALVLAGDLEGAVPVDVPQLADRNTLRGGGGFKLRVGDRIWLGRGLRFIPELGYGYDHLFATDDSGNSYDWDTHRLFGGARFVFGRILTPVVYAHLGYGWRSTGDPSAPSASGLAFDVGGALDLRVIPHLGVGAHVEYAMIDAQPYTPKWVAFGLHADLTF